MGGVLAHPVPMTQKELHEEYAVQYRAYLNGRFERSVHYDSKAAAERQAVKFNAKAKKGADCRVAKRQVTKWEPV